MSLSIAGRLFDDERQERFAALSGDRNPIHMDADVSRRSRFGGPIVHGWNMAMWAIDAALGTHPDLAGRSPTSINATMKRAVLVGETVSSTPVLASDTVTMTLATRGGPFATVTVGLGDRHQPVDTVVDAPTPQLTIESPELMPGLSGSLPIQLDRAVADGLFPGLRQWMGADTMASMVSVSAVVGMRCPGEHSIESSWRATLHPEQPCGGSIDYRLARVDDRFGLVEMHLTNPTFDCNVVTFQRPVAVRQPSSSNLQAMVADDRFAGQRALVVGGSRGLGEVATKLLALGCADVVFTFHGGSTQATAIAAELAALDRPVRTLHYDIAEPAALGDALDRLDWRPTTLYYFATPAGAVGGTTFDSELVERFSRFTVTGLADTFDACHCEDLTAVFVPSLDVDAPPAGLAEYVAAKRTGELWCANLQRQYPGLQVLSQRLPRLHTDQTATVVPTEFEPIAGVLLPHLDALHLHQRNGVGW